MDKLLVITGKSGAGKTAVVEQLVKHHGFTKIVTYTTRPMRPAEVDGVDYHFVKREDFHVEEFADYRAYTVASGETWYYGTKTESLMCNAGERKVIILTPSGVESIRAKGIDCFCIEITVTPKTRYQRVVERGDDVAEAKRRFAADEKDFAGFSATRIENDGVIDATIDTLLRCVENN